MDPRLHPFLVDQAGVVSRQQALRAGLAKHDVIRLVRRRELVALHPGVYVDHTGEPTWLQRAWGAVLLCRPAALSHQSALRMVEGPGTNRSTRIIELSVPHERRPAPPAGIEVHRVRRLEGRVMWQVGPPRVRYEEAALDVAAAATSELAA